MPQGKIYVPGFRIAGKWLKNLGFDYGDTVTVKPQADGTILIAKTGGSNG